MNKVDLSRLSSTPLSRIDDVEDIRVPPGRLEMSRAVLLIHISLGDGRWSEMECFGRDWLAESVGWEFDLLGLSRFI